MCCTQFCIVYQNCTSYSVTDLLEYETVDAVLVANKKTSELYIKS